jgi:hypothetical protein
MTTQHETGESSGASIEPTQSDKDALHREAEHLADEARELWHKVAQNDVWHRMGDRIKKPSVGAAIAGAAVLAAGAVWGASEAAVAAIAAYAVFRMLRKRRERREERSTHDETTETPATPPPF